MFTFAVRSMTCIFRFLKVPSIVEDQRLWQRLLRPESIRQFEALFSKYAIRFAISLFARRMSSLILPSLNRTMKASVQDELTIPKQTRFLVPIALGKVERHVSKICPTMKVY